MPRPYLDLWALGQRQSRRYSGGARPSASTSATWRMQGGAARLQNPSPLIQPKHRRNRKQQRDSAGGRTELSTGPKKQVLKPKGSAADRDNKLPISQLEQKHKFNQWLEQFGKTPCRETATTYAPADLTLAAGGPE